MVNRAAQAIVPRTAGESMMVGAMGSLGPKQRRLLKGLSLVDQVDSLLPEEYDVVPLMANLVVDQSKRRSGLGLTLFEAARETCAAWGFDQIWLEVEASNEPARKFYETVKALGSACALFHKTSPFGLFTSAPVVSVLFQLCACCFCSLGRNSGLWRNGQTNTMKAFALMLKIRAPFCPLPSKRSQNQSNYK